MSRNEYIYQTNRYFKINVNIYITEIFIFLNNYYICSKLFNSIIFNYKSIEEVYY